MSVAASLTGPARSNTSCLAIWEGHACPCGDTLPVSAGVLPLHCPKQSVFWQSFRISWQFFRIFLRFSALDGVENSDEGRYLCQVVPVSSGNRFGQVDIKVIGDFFPASKSEASSTASFQRGHRQTLPCECASQTPDVMYWSTGEGVTTDTQIIGARFSDGATLQIQHGADNSIGSDASLTVNSLHEVQVRQRFWCHVFQSDGTLRNCATNVQISDAPNPTGALQASETSFYLQEGLRQVLPCTSWIPGTETCEIQWLKLDIPNQNVLSYNLSTNQIEAPVTGYDLASDFGLVIASAEDDHAGRYRCDLVDTATESAEIEVRIIGNQFPLDGGSATADDAVSFEPDRKLSFTCLAKRNISLTTKATLFWSYGALDAHTTTVVGKLDLLGVFMTLSDLGDDCFQTSTEGSLILNNCSQDDDVRYWCHVFPDGGVVIRSYVDSRLKTPTGNPDSFYILPLVLCICVLVIVFLLIAMLLVWNRRKQESIPTFDVKKLRGKIETFIKKTFSQIPITPWVTWADADKAPMGKVYVPTEMLRNVPFQDGIVRYKLNSESEIFDDGDEELGNMHVLINGRSGSGKSTLLYKVACDWSKGRKDALLAEKKLVFFVPATVLIQTGNLGQAVVEHMLPSQPKTLASSINEYCCSHPSDVALLVDGCKGEQDIDAVMRIMKEQGLLECQMIMTTMNAKIARDACNQYNMRHITINGFTPDNVHQYVNNILEILLDRNPGEKSPKKIAATTRVSKHTDTVVTMESTPLIPSPQETAGMIGEQKSHISLYQRIKSDEKHSRDEKPQSKDTPITGSSKHPDTVVNIESTSPSTKETQDTTGVYKESTNDLTHDEERQSKGGQKSPSKDAPGTESTTHTDTNIIMDSTQSNTVPTDSQQITGEQNTDVFSDLRRCLDEDILPPQFVCLPANLAALCQLCVWTKGEAFRSNALTIGDVCYRLVKCMFQRSKPIRDDKSLNEETVFGYGAHLKNIVAKEQLELLIELGKVIWPQISKYYEGTLTLSESDFLGTEGGQEALEAAFQVGLLCRCKNFNRKSTVGSTELNADIDVKVLKPNNRCSCFCCRQSVQSESEIPLIPRNKELQIQNFVLEILEQLCVGMYLAHSTESVSNWFEEMTRTFGLRTSLDKISSVVSFACRENQNDREAAIKLLVKIVKTGRNQSKSLKDVLPVQKSLELALEINRDSNISGSANKTLNMLFDKGTIRLIGVSRHKIRLLVYLFKHAQEGGGDGKLNVKSIELFRIGRNDWKDVREMFAGFVQVLADVGKNTSNKEERQAKEDNSESPTPPHSLDTKTHSATSRQEHIGEHKGEHGAQDPASLTSDKTCQDENQNIKMSEQDIEGSVSKEPEDEENHPGDKQQPNDTALQMSSDTNVEEKDPQAEQRLQDASASTESQDEGNTFESNLQADENESQTDGGVKSKKKRDQSSKSPKNKTGKKLKPQSKATPPDDDKTKNEADNPPKVLSQFEQISPIMKESGSASQQLEERQTPEPKNDDASSPASLPHDTLKIPSSTKSFLEVDQLDNKGPTDDVASQKSKGEEIHPSPSSYSTDCSEQDVMAPTKSQGEGNKFEDNLQTDETESQTDRAQVGKVKSAEKRRKSSIFSTKKNTKGEKENSQSKAAPPDDDKTRHEAENLQKDSRQSEQNAQIKIESESPSKQPKEQQTPAQKNKDAIPPDSKIEVHQPENGEPVDFVPSQKSSEGEVYSSPSSHSLDHPLEALGKVYKPETLRALRKNVESRNEDMPWFHPDQSDISVLHTVQSFGLQETVDSQCGECHSSNAVKDFIHCLPELKTLESLILVGTILSPKDICSLASHLNKITKLKKLDLRLNQLFDDRAFEAVTDSLHACKELRELRLSLYRVTKDGFSNVKTKMEKGGGKSWERLETLYLLHASPAEPLVEFLSDSLKYLHDIEYIHMSASSPNDEISENVLRDVKHNMENPDYVTNLKMPVMENMEQLKSTLAQLKLPKGKKKQTRDLVPKLVETVLEDIPSLEEIKRAGRGAVIGAKIGSKVAGKKGAKVGTVIGAAAGSVLG
ncbi:uncharacterized protein LOC119732020 [Patiria miniata]|uniref:Ig-like domain-containing protein n=1 Tax=Patiria miniata TaxID=46514 RepID=A0A914ACX3_PATMI|nr:uncharacterized protein LOC119732020 [Patiria miniata]